MKSTLSQTIIGSILDTNKHNRWMLLGCLSVILLLSSACAADALDQQTLCPVNGSEQQTILLIDTTNPLTPIAQEKLKKLLEAFRDSGNEHYLQTGHELIIYRLTSDVTTLKKLLQVCNPSNPKDRTWWDVLTEGKYPGLRKWRHFEREILQALPKRDEQVTENQSPLLETLALVIARHVSSIGVARTERKPTRLILFSDMLQHSDRLSHYKSLPKMKTFKALPGYAAMESDLRDVDVWLYYVRRKDHQPPKHYYWWTQVIELFGGRVMAQVPM